MIVLRSLVFNAFFLVWTISAGVIGIPFILTPQRVSRLFGRFWARGVIFGLRVIIGLEYEVRGQHINLSQPVIFACKHQSSWETVALNFILPNASIIFKEELARIPIFGWHVRSQGMISVDRKGGAAALKQMVERARAVVRSGRSVLIFPEGTRTVPGEERPYQVGVAALYSALSVTVVPVALNSGWFWGRRSFLKKPGKIVIEFLQPIPPGLPRREFIRVLRDQIESSTKMLEPDKLGC